MELRALIQGLNRPEAYDPPASEVEVAQTHISVVFLTPEFVYKIKKPVDLGFLDFTTLDLRERYCREEVRLNRRLAPDVYLGVVPVVAADDGLRFHLDEAPPPAERVVEWAVRMRRLPADLTMASWIADGTLRAYHVAVLARRVAEFHARAARGPEISRWGRFEVVAGNARENLAQAVPHLMSGGGAREAGEASHGPAAASIPASGTLAPELHARLTEALERELTRLAPLIEARAAAGRPCDTHGDLHLDHVYIFADRAPPDDIVIIDCIEFNERFRYADPVADLAFLDMDLRHRGRADLAEVLTDVYFDAAADAEGRDLLAFYSAYRAAVRAKVAGMKAAEPEVPEADRARATASARSHWLLALGLLEPPARRPCLVLIGGLPGTGKSTLARSLAARAGFEVLSSDPTRKRLAGLDPETSAATAFGAGIYTAEWNERTYAALRADAERGLLEGRRVIVDASFREDGRRAAFLELARALRVPAVLLRLEAPPERVRARIAARVGGPSDADADIYEGAAARWEPASAATAPATRPVDTGQSPAWSVEQSVAHLRQEGLIR